MSLRRSVLFLISQTLVLAALAGCTPPPPPPPPAPATPHDISQLQSDLQFHDPGARAGSVTRVRSDENLVAVELAGYGTSKQAVKVDDPITFTDPNQTPVANGSVVSIDGSLLVVKYSPIAGGRAPQEGDIAVHLSSP